MSRRATADDDDNRFAVYQSWLEREADVRGSRAHALSRLTDGNAAEAAHERRAGAAAG